MIQPPTDNLYRFLAVSGLLVSGFSVYFPLQYLQEYNRAALEYHASRAQSLERIANRNFKRPFSRTDNLSPYRHIVNRHFIGRRGTAEDRGLRTEDRREALSKTRLSKRAQLIRADAPCA